MLRTPKGRRYFLVDPLAQRVPQFLGDSVLVGAQPLVLACWDGSVKILSQIHFIRQ